MILRIFCLCFFFSSRRRHTRSDRDWSSDVCSSDLDSQLLMPDALEGIEIKGGEVHFEELSSTVKSAQKQIALAEAAASSSGGNTKDEIGRASCRERV